MTRVVVKFRDGSFTNVEADGFYQEGGFMTAYKRNDAHNTVVRGMCFETVGRFHEDTVGAIYVSEKSDK